MKEKFLILAAVALMMSGSLFAQEKKQKPTPEQRIEKRVAMMQRKLMLDDATAAKFAPIYKEYLQAMAENCKPCGKCENPTDTQIKENIAKRIDAQQKALDIEEKYFKKLSTVLSGRQLQKVFCKDADKNFRKPGKMGGFGKCDRPKGGKKPCMMPPCPEMQGKCPKAQSDCPKADACPVQPAK